MNAMATPIPRDPELQLDAVPRHWFAGNAAATAISNGLNMLFPAGERYFVRSVNHYLDQITDPELRTQIKGFFGQEGRHARAHDQLNAVLRAQGYRIDGFLARYAKLSRWIEDRLPAKLNLAGTAAAEHFTAIMAESAFTDHEFELLDPEMQKLLAWHAAEELEHKAVAFDVLREIDPSYALRIAGLAYATVLLAGFWLWGTTVLLRQDKLTWRAALRDLAKVPSRGPTPGGVFARGIRSYLRRNFHPSQQPTDGLAAAWFAEHGIPFTEAA